MVLGFEGRAPSRSFEEEEVFGNLPASRQADILSKSFNDLSPEEMFLFANRADFIAKQENFQELQANVTYKGGHSGVEAGLRSLGDSFHGN